MASFDSNATIGGGSRVATVRNEKGVVLKLRGRQSGLQASLGLSGMTITLQQAGDPRTASALNLTVPSVLLHRADEMIK